MKRSFVAVALFLSSWSPLAAAGEPAPKPALEPLDGAIGIAFGTTRTDILAKVPTAQARRSDDVADRREIEGGYAAVLYRILDGTMYRVDAMFIEPIPAEGMTKIKLDNYGTVDAGLVKRFGEGTSTCNEDKTVCTREWSNGQFAMRHKLTPTTHEFEAYDIQRDTDRVEEGRKALGGGASEY